MMHSSLLSDQLLRSCVIHLAEHMQMMRGVEINNTEGATEDTTEDTCDGDGDSGRDQSCEGRIEDNDYITECMGAFGKWQAGYCAIAASTRFVALWNMLSIVFITPNTEFHCKLSRISTGDMEQSTCYDDCVSYEYEKSTFDDTLTSEFGLICENAWLASFTQTILMFGVLVGAPLYGWVSDRFGRRPAIRSALVTVVIFMLAAPFSPNYILFTTLRFLIGISTGGILVCSSVYILEMVGTVHRERAGSCTVLPDGFAGVFLSLFAYYTSSSWRNFLFIYSIPAVIVLLLVMLLPETPRWLVSKRKTQEAVDLLTLAAKCNKLTSDHIEYTIIKHIDNMEMSKIDYKETSIFDLFRNKELAFKTTCMLFVYMATIFTYFGVNQFIPQIGSNVYLDFALISLVQVPPSALSALITRFAKRRASTILTLVVTSASMTVLIFASKGSWQSTVFGLIGVCAISTTFPIVSIHISELYPTPLRTMAFGVIVCGGKIGSMVSPYIATLSPQWIPSLVFTVTSLAGSLVCLLLPETKGLNLRDTLT